MEAQAIANPTKTYINKMQAILDSDNLDDWDKVYRISKITPPTDNPNAILIERIAHMGRVPKPAPGSDQTAAGLATAIARRTLAQIFDIFYDLKDLNLYSFVYQFDAYYQRPIKGNFDQRKLTRFVDTEDFPTKVQARELALPWVKNLPRSFHEADSKVPYELVNVVVYCATIGSHGPFIDYENIVTKEKAGVLVPNSQDPSGARAVGDFNE